jgi:FtsZ-binding cell division protein ZapB
VSETFSSNAITGNNISISPTTATTTSNNNTPATSSTNTSNNTVVNKFFSVGDKVKVVLSVEQFRQCQEGHGGWNQKMSDLIGKIGTVHRVTEKSDIRVQYEGNTDNRWTICPSALTKIECNYMIGDYVRMNNDEETVKLLQKDHGEWSDSLKLILGKICRIITVYSDSDLRVSYNGTFHTINPECCTSVPKNQADIYNTIAYHNMEDATTHIANQFKVKIKIDIFFYFFLFIKLYFFK